MKKLLHTALALLTALPAAAQTVGSAALVATTWYVPAAAGAVFCTTTTGMPALRAAFTRLACASRSSAVRASTCRSTSPSAAW